MMLTTIHFLFSLLFLLLVGSAKGESQGFSRLRYSGAIRRKSQPKHSRTRNNSNDDVQEWHIPQQLDHFRLGDTRSFLQRYFSSNRYVRNFAKPNHALDQDAQPTSFAFLCVGGEGPPLDESVLIDSVHCTGDMLELADRLFHERSNTSIHLFALEHRYYGKSYPQFENSTSPITNENLVYLSSRQAQADLAHFVSTQQASLPSNTQWVTFGGSYPGMMAAYARLRFPHLISAAVSSSAPVQATLDFAAYNGHVGKVLRMENIGGSDRCFDIIQEGHDALSNILSSSNTNTSAKAQVAQDFDVCNPTTVFLDAQNVALFLGDGVIDLGTQGNDPACHGHLCNIAKICRGVVHQVDKMGKTPMQSLQWLAAQQRSLHHVKDCVDMSWKNALAFLADPTQGLSEGIRSWLWQTCTEWGFYQTCEDSNADCPFGRGWHKLDEDLEICEKAFGVEPLQVAKAVQDSLDYYGGWRLAATKILSVNGDVDPWSELAIQHSDDANLPALVVPGASHHFWTHPSKDSDSVEVVASRQHIHRTVIQWLDENSNREETSMI